MAFTGAPGAYSQEAARRYFGSGHPTLTCRSVAEAVQAVTTGRASHAVLPVENSITGCFPGVTEALFEAELEVVGELILRIRNCLMAAPGAKLDDLTVITSHVIALSQCRDWLTNWGVATRPSPDTAEAARELSRTGDAALGVIGSMSLAQMYGLDILAEGISDRPDNRTRFLIVSRDREQAALGPRVRSGLLVGPLTAPRALKTLRIQLESLGARRARVPFLGSEDGRRFLVEFDHGTDAGPAIVELAFAGLPHRSLGSWALPPDAGAVAADPRRTERKTSA